MRSSVLALTLAALLAGCGAPSREPDGDTTGAEAMDDTTVARERMVQEQLSGRGISDSAVLAAMRRVPRHRFVPMELRAQSYGDHPLPIGMGQTISQPYIVAYMTELAAPRPGERALEVGTGSGYQAAVLAEIGVEVYSIEIIPELARTAEETLRGAGYDGVQLRLGDGYRGWPEAAPFDVIMVTAAPDHVPQALIDQLALGGRLVIPVGRQIQQLLLIRRTAEGVIEERTIPVRFVPLLRDP